MKKFLGTCLILLGLVVFLLGVGWRIFSGDREIIAKRITSGDYSGALDTISSLRSRMLFQAVRLIPGVEEDIVFKEAWALYRLGDKERAAKLFRELANSKNIELGASALFNAATLELAPESFERAVRDYEEVLKKSPNSTSAQRNLEILRKIEEEERRTAGRDDDSDKKDGDAEAKDGVSEEDKPGKDKQKRSRTKDKFEYRDDGSGGQDGSSKFRY